VGMHARAARARGDSRLLAGADKASLGRIEKAQRTRILSAAASVLGEVGYGGMSVARVTSRAGVSRRTFCEHFDDCDDCFLALFDAAIARAAQVVGQAVDATIGTSADSWRGRVRAGLFVLLALLEDDPALGSLLVVEPLRGGPKVLARRAHVLETLQGVIAEGRQARQADCEPPALTAEGVLGAVLSVIHARLLMDATWKSADGTLATSARNSFTEELNPLMAMIVLPYLGQAAAAEELSFSSPTASPNRRAQSASRELSGDPLRGIEMRLTYRTLLVLSAIAESPGASNRQVADIAEVQDQGQISKLLRRLERTGLIRNTNAAQAKGEPNAWELTPKGHEVETALSA
jgi:AcrR family transcriptional regulator